MTQRKSSNSSSVALVAMFFLLMTGKVFNMYYVELLSREILHSKEVVIRAHADIEVMKKKIYQLEDSLIKQQK